MWGLSLLAEAFLEQVTRLVTYGFDHSVVVSCCLSVKVLRTLQDLLTLFFSRRFKFRRRASSLCSALVNSTLSDFNLTSTGATASVLKAKANGVS